MMPSTRHGSGFSSRQRPRATIVDRLHQQTLKTLQEPKVKDRLTKLGVDPMTMTPAEFDALVRKEISLNAALVKAIGLKPE